MKKVKRYGISVLAALLVTAVIGAGALFRVDKWMQDKLFQHRGVTSRDIVIIGIDDEALDLLGPYNTWDRNIMASALEALAADPDKLPAVTAIDVLYAGRTGDQADERLAAAARNLGNVITASMAEFGQEITWEDGTKYEIDRITDIRQAAAMKAGGQGDRYTVMIRGMQSFLFFERCPNQSGNNIGRWFVERR